MHAAPTTLVLRDEPHEGVERAPPLPLFRRRGGAEGGGMPLWAYLVITALTVTIVVGGYKWGFRAQDKPKKGGVTDTLAREGVVRSQIRTCDEKRNQLWRAQQPGAADADVTARGEQVASLRAENERLFAEYTELETKKLHCEEAQEMERAMLEAASKKELQALQKQLQEAEAQYAAISSFSAGARRQLLLHVLKRRRQNNNRLRHALLLPVPQAAEEYEESLISKWNVSETADGFPDAIAGKSWWAASRIKAPDGANYTLEQEIQAVVALWPQFVYNASRHVDIFFTPNAAPFDAPPIVDEAAVALPSYFGRTGNAQTVRGVLPRTQLARLSLAQVMRVVVRVSACAIKTNNPNFTVPSAFLRPRGSAADSEEVRQAATTVLEAPLIVFCRKCAHTIQTAEFKLACDGNDAAVLAPSSGQTASTGMRGIFDEHPRSVYGGYAFWVARSHVRFTPRVIIKAGEYMRSAHLLPNTTLAVDFKRSDAWESACRAKIAPTTLPLKHFMWLAGRAMASNESLREVSADDVVRQCAPSLTELQRGIVSIAQARDYLDTVFIMADAEDRDALEHQLQTLDLGPLQVVLSFPTDVLADAVELEVMAQCDSILVNRFMEHSQHATELYLLQNKFAPEGVHFF